MSYLKLKIGNVHREMETVRKNLKTAVREMKNVFYRLIIRLNIDEERINEYEERSIEIVQHETQREKKRKRKEKQNKNVQELWDTIKRYNISEDERDPAYI